MKRMVAIYFGWLAFVVGCSATTSVDDGVAGPGNEQPGSGEGEVTPTPEARTLVPIPSIDLGGLPITAPPLVESSGGTTEEPVNIPEELPPPIDTGTRIIEGNPTCAEAFPNATSASFSIERLRDETYDLGGLSVTVDFDGNTVDLSATEDIIGVIVKGGTAANAYTLLSTSAADLTTPYGHAISHVTICYSSP